MGSSPLDRKIKGTMLSDLFHLVGFHVNDQEVLKRFNDSDDSPFAFHNISKVHSTNQHINYICTIHLKNIYIFLKILYIFIVVNDWTGFLEEVADIGEYRFTLSWFHS